MALQESMIKQGNWLFKYRSYVPVPILLIALYYSAARLPGEAGNLSGLGWELACFAVGLIGLTVRVITAGHVPTGTSGRNTQQQRADHLNITGMYSIVRNPLYLGNFLMSFSAVLWSRSWVFSTLYVLVFFFYYERIIFAEENFLREKFKTRYLNWAAQTPMLIPAFKGWHASTFPLSWRVVIRQEFTTLSALVFTLTLLKVAEGSLSTGQPLWDPFWLWVFALVQGGYMVVLVLIKATHVLDVKRG